jgi:hypothetical protein
MLGIHDPAPASRSDHRRREIGRDHTRDATGKRFGDVARPGRKIEHDVGWLRTDRRQKRLGHRDIDGGDKLALGLPAGGGSVPAPPGLIRALYAATPLNWGRMSRPYVARISSCPWVIR